MRIDLLRLSPRAARRASRTVLALTALGLGAAAHCGAAEPAAAGPAPAWLYPADSAAYVSAASEDRSKPQHVPGGAAAYSKLELANRYAAPDWHPESHTPMPPIVARGRAGEVYACGYCHGAGGEGRPENAPLAGLAAPYIVAQVADFRSGARRSANPGEWHDSGRPSSLMIALAARLTDAEVAAAAEYYAAQRPRPRVRVVESERAPVARVAGLVYVAIEGRGDEPLGERLLEFTPDAERHENRDDALVYVAYVPPGSIARGRALAGRGAQGPASACTACHGDRLQGVGPVPSLAGRSPSYLLRQLYAFSGGARAGAAGAQMREVAARLGPGAMIDAVAYAASLPP